MGPLLDVAVLLLAVTVVASLSLLAWSVAMSTVAAVRAFRRRLRASQRALIVAANDGHRAVVRARHAVERLNAATGARAAGGTSTRLEADRTHDR